MQAVFSVLKESRHGQFYHQLSTLSSKSLTKVRVTDVTLPLTRPLLKHHLCQILSAKDARPPSGVPFIATVFAITYTRP